MALQARLLSHQERRRAEDGRPGGTVRGYVRAHLEEIVRAHQELTWDDIAAAIGEEGVIWRTGQAPTGKDIRTLVCRLRARTTRKDEQAERALRPAEPRSEARVQTPRTVAAVPVSAPRAVDTAPRNRVLEEMRRATRERS